MIRRLFLLLFLLQVLGCSAPAVTRHYALAPLAESPAASRDGSLLVSELRLPHYLDRAQLVTRSGSHRLEVSDHHQWGGNLREDMTRILAENLGLLLGSNQIVAAPRTLRSPPDFRVEVEVLRFERGPDARVHLSARWWLTRAAENVPLENPRIDLQGAPLDDKGGFDAIVASMSAVYNELARRIAHSIRGQPKARP